MDAVEVFSVLKVEIECVIDLPKGSDFSWILKAKYPAIEFHRLLAVYRVVYNSGYANTSRPHILRQPDGCIGDVQCPQL
jgi:hypothetical protein